MDTTVTINGLARTDLTVRRITQSYVAPWSCEMAYVGRHDVQPVPCRINEWVHVRDVDTGTLLFRGNITQISPGGVADEGIDLLAQGRRFRLENEPVNINGSGVYIWNARGHLCSHNSGEDSPGRDGGKWTVGEIVIDILEHALGIPDAGSDIPGHHSSPGCVTDPYLTADDILSYDASEWLALDSMIGEFGVDNTPVAVAISELVSLNGGFYGWFIDPYGVLRLINLDALPETDIEAGELGQWQDADDTNYSLLDNRLDWSLDGVYSEVMVQGTDRTVEVKPVNLDGCANEALNGGGELELVDQPWKGWDCAYRALDQPYRPWTWKGVGFTGSCGEGEEWRDICECGIPEGSFGVYSGARIYRGTDAGAKSLCTPPLGGYNWRVNLRTGIVMFYWDVAADLDPGEKLWGWYWARRPFTVTAGPTGNAYTCLGYERTLKIFDPGYRHTTTWPQQGQPDDETAMGILAERMLEQYKDVRIQGIIVADEVLTGLNLLRRYSVTRLEEFITEAPATSTTSTIGEICSPDPLDWGRLGLNAVEVTWDFTQNTVELTLANTFFMLEGYSAVKARLKLNLFASMEFTFSEDIVDCQVNPSSGSPEGTTLTEWPTTTTTTAEPVTTTTAADCNECDPAIPETLHVTLCGLLGDFAPYNGDHTLTYVSYCVWRVALEGAWIELTYEGINWIVTLNVTRGTSCRKRWTADGEDELECIPQGDTAAYAALDCLDDTCADHESCEDSVAATCEVSDAGESCPTTTTVTPSCEDCSELSDNCYLLDFEGECGEPGTHPLIPCADGNWDGYEATVVWMSSSEFEDLGVTCLWQGDLEAQDSDCLACDPPMHEIFRVSFSGLAGDFAPYNGYHCLYETSECEWTATLDGATLHAYRDTGDWYIDLILAGSIPPVSGPTTTTPGDACAIRWKELPFPSACGLQGNAFRIDECWDDACDDAQSCIDSLGATGSTDAIISPGVADLTYRPDVGWLILVGETIWMKEDFPYDYCEPRGYYNCILGGAGTVLVSGPVTCPGTTTAAPTTTTEAPPITTTTEAPPCPEDCSDCDPASSTVFCDIAGITGSGCPQTPYCGTTPNQQLCTFWNAIGWPALRGAGASCTWTSAVISTIYHITLSCADGVWTCQVRDDTASDTLCLEWTVADDGSGCVPATNAWAWTGNGCCTGTPTLTTRFS